MLNVVWEYKIYILKSMYSQIIIFQNKIFQMCSVIEIINYQLFKTFS